MQRTLTVLVLSALVVATVPAVSLAAPPASVPGVALEALLSPFGAEALARPASAPAAAQALSETVALAPTSLSHAYATLLRGTQGLDASPPAFVVGPLVSEVALAYEEAGAPLPPAAKLALARDAAGLDPRVERALATLVAGMRAAEKERGAPFAALTAHDLATLAARSVVGADAAPDASSANLLGAAEPTDLLAARDALSRIDAAALVRSHLALAVAVDEASALLVGPQLAMPGTVFETGTPYGRIVVQGGGDDVVPPGDETFVRIDLGGADTYLNGAGSSRADILGLTLATPPPGPTDPTFPAWAATTERLVHDSHNASILLDLGGDDTYLAPGPGAQGYGGWGGFGALVDLGGTDTYAASTFAQGAGQVAGAGFLVDVEGQDAYVADRQAQAYAQDAGAGLLLDGQGADTYDAQVLAQGTGYSADLLAALVDGNGDDAYRCHGVIDSSDSILPVNAPRPGSLCHATGFGGTAVLIDLGGDDLYTTASSFQAMTLIGTGILVDASGDDRYLAGEWSNGVGVLGAAVVLDLAGADRYESRQVTPAPWSDVYIGSNGEGYLGVGVLADGGGDDSYLSVANKALFLPQFACGSGCSYSGGTGVLLDAAGDDRYTTEVGIGGAFLGIALHVDGDGNDVRQLTEGSIRGEGYAETTPLILVILPGGPSSCYYGVLADRAGTDAYSNPVTTYGTRADDQHWGQGTYGRGMDGMSGITGYLTSPEFQDDVGRLIDQRGCETVSPIVFGLTCPLAGVGCPPGSEP